MERSIRVRPNGTEGAPPVGDDRMDELRRRLSNLSPRQRSDLARLIETGTEVGAPPVGGDRVHELRYRLSKMSPRQRSDLARLIETGTDKGAPPVGDDRTTVSLQSLLDNSSDDIPMDKAECRRFYDAINSQLDASMFGEHSFFLNYGYVPDGTAEYAAVELPTRFINRNSVKLVLEVIGDTSVDESHVLDVGCGRGGAIYTLKTFFNPASVTGLDLSPNAIEFDRQAHGDDRTSFVEGDAESLPFSAGAFDIVVNIESSHSYQRVDRFYSEVARVLRAGGYFLYADALSTQQFSKSVQHLGRLGLGVERMRDITANVLLSCDEIAESRVQAFERDTDHQVIENFLAAPGSEAYEELRSGKTDYRILKLRKRHGAGPSTTASDSQ
jgi:SAM-dependent methyltransferase